MSRSSRAEATESTTTTITDHSEEVVVLRSDGLGSVDFGRPADE